VNIVNFAFETHLQTQLEVNEVSDLGSVSEFVTSDGFHQAVGQVGAVHPIDGIEPANPAALDACMQSVLFVQPTVIMALARWPQRMTARCQIG
jgi:hypothetical protein